MPIYEYRCEECGDFERTQRITDPPLQRCPTCRRKVQRLISSTSFQLKGSGWYVTDYARGGKSGDAKGAESKGAESKSGSETKDGATGKGSGESAEKPAKKAASKSESKSAGSSA